MTRRTRLFLLIAGGVLVAGLGTGLIASYMGLQDLPLFGSDGPAELAYVPADARVVAYVDVHQVMTSELRQKFRELHPDAGPNGTLQEQTGINLDTDVDHVVVGLLPGDESGHLPLMLARGRFNDTQIEGLIRQKGGRVEDYKGKRLLVLADGSQSAALTFAEPGLAIFGHVAAVRAAIDTRAASQNVTGNREIMALVRDVEDSNAWAVGKFDALTNGGRLPSNVVQQLPPINMFAASGHINGGVRATLRAEARDDAAAQSLREVVKGFVALARLQAGRNEQLTTLLNSVELAGDGRTVALTVTIPVGAIDLLTPHDQAPHRQARSGF